MKMTFKAFLARLSGQGYEASLGKGKGKVKSLRLMT